MEIIHSFVFGVLFFKFFLVVLFEKQNIYMVVILIGIQMIWQIIYAYYSEWYVKIFTESSNAGIQESMYTILFNKMLTVDMGTLESPEYYDTFRMVMQNSTGAIIAITNNIFSYIKNIILLVLNGCLLFSYEPMLFVFIILSVACSYCSNILKNKYQVEKNRTVNPLLRKYEYVKRIFYSAEYAADIKCTDVYEVLIKNANITNDDIRKKQEEINKKLLVISSLSAILSVILRQISNIWLGTNALLTKRFTSGDIAVAISSMVNMRNTLNTFLNLYPQIQESKIYVADYMHYIETESDIKENEKGDLPKRGANSIQIKNVSFSYDGQKEILKDINMEIREGEKIAIIGKNGAGKSTLVKLLLQLYKPQSGQIAMDQKPAETYILKAYRERFGVAFQNTQLYSVSVAENVLMKTYDGEPKEKDRIIDALKNSRLYNRIDEEDKGIDTIVTKEFDGSGIEFSGGQTQKLAMSRVFASECGIVILDEPSAALDPIGEAEMYESMLEAMKEKTVILIAHRLSICRKVDRIYVIDDGKIAEEGTHGQLLKKNGLYAEMWNVQASAYR